MKKGVYIIYEELTDETGVNKKIKSQIETFEKVGFAMNTVCMDINKVPGWKILSRLPFTNITPCWRWSDAFAECDFIYFRHPVFLNLALIRLLKKIKKKNPKVKIIMELPTYPYDKEYLRFKKNIPFLIKDKIIRGGIDGIY